MKKLSILRFQARTCGKWLLVFPLAFLLCIIVKDGWLSDDSYITLRVVANFLHGYGLTWNTNERVQVYTHPLWMFCLSLTSFFTHEFYYSTLILSIVLSFMAITLFSLYLAKSPLLATLGIFTLAASKSFVDFATSGLENPVTYLLIVIFMLIFYHVQQKRYYLFLLALITGLATFNRMDTLLLFIPAIIMIFCQCPSWKSVNALLLGFLPFVCWEIFSLCYYGFLFPNTAYAKLDTGISSVQLFMQGIGYFVSSFTFDPLLFVVIAASMFFVVQQRVWRDLPFLIGMGLYLFYTVKIGGDFMAGRFLTEPFLIAVILLTHTSFPPSKSNYVLAFAIILLFEIVTPNSRWYPLIHNHVLIDQKGVADERSYLVETATIVHVGPLALWPKPLLLVKGLPSGLSGQHVVVRTTIGYFGFVAGPHVHIVDIWALADPLLARLPALPSWRIGHFERAIPAGYLETLARGKNVIHDQHLAAYYSKLQQITRDPLFSAQRWIAIWELNV